MKSVKKIIISVMVAALIACMSLSLFACGSKVEPKAAGAAFADAQAAWMAETGSKSAVDDIDLKVSIPVANMKAEISAKAQIKRNYKGDKIDSIEATIGDVSVTGLKTVLNAVGSLLPASIKDVINSIVVDGNIKIDGVVAEGKITAANGKYLLEGTIHLKNILNTWEDIGTKGTPYDGITVDFVDDLLKDFSVNIDFDMMSLFDLSKSTAVSADANANVALTYNPVEALAPLGDQLFSVIDKFLAGNLTTKIKELFRPTFVDKEAVLNPDNTVKEPAKTAAEVEAEFDKTIVDVIAKANQYINQFSGKTGAGSAKALLNKLLDLGSSSTANVTIANDKIGTVKLQQVAKLTITYTDAEQVMNIINEFADISAYKGAITGLLWPIDKTNASGHRDFVITATVDVSTKFVY